MAGNSAVPCGEIPLRLHAPTCLATFRQKKLEMAWEKTMPIGIINLANLTAVAAAAAIVAAQASAQNKYDPGASDTENTEHQVRVRFLLPVIAME
jgi:hypothetical protein